MTELTRHDIERARLQVAPSVEGDQEPGVLCEALEHVVPLVRALKDDLLRVARDNRPGWLPGFLADLLLGAAIPTAIDQLVGALEDWRDSTCTDDPEPENTNNGSS